MTALFVLLVGLLAAACVAPTPVADQAALAPTAAALPVETAASVAPGDEPAAVSASPAEVTAAFYTWYLDYIGATGSEDMRNPLVDGAYRASPYLTQSLIGHIDELLAKMRAQDRGGYDPFLLAQDIPQDFSVDPGVEPGTAVVHLQFGPDSVRHLLVTMDDSGRKIAAIAEDAGRPLAGSITIESVQVDDEQVTVRGRSTLPDGTCLGSELWAGGELAAWWPADACARVDRSAWRLVVPLGAGQAPAELDPDVQYMLRAFLPGGPDIVSVFAFDLAGPPAPENP
jgi:hypothetical protein